MRRRISSTAACDRARAFGSAELDGPLPEHQRVELDRHLQGCPECERIVAGMANVTQRVRTAAPATPAVPGRVTMRRRRSPVLAIAMVTIVLAAAVVGAVLGGRSTGSTAASVTRNDAAIAQRFHRYHEIALENSLGSGIAGDTVVASCKYGRSAAGHGSSTICGWQ
jgi:predicted anti-sigma-YlaC factor YlaD